MARGQQKIQSQQKNKERQDKLKKQQSHDQKKAAQAALKYMCTACKSHDDQIIPEDVKRHRKLNKAFELVSERYLIDAELLDFNWFIYKSGNSCQLCKNSQMPDPKTYKQHFENKHPKLELPEELKAI